VIRDPVAVSGDPVAMTCDPVRAIADALLYEGYILWPYRRSALKNQRRFTFGGVYPPAHSERHPDDADGMQTEVLLRARPSTRVRIAVRFLQVVQRQVARRRGESLELVEELVAGGQTHLAWEEAVEREVHLRALWLAELQEGVSVPIEIAGGRVEEQLPERAGAVVRVWEGLAGELAVAASPACDNVVRMSVRIRNTTPSRGAGSREDALAHTFCSTHTVLAAQDGEFVSLTDPPPGLAGAAALCTNVGTWPVLVGEPPEAGAILSSPIILEDYPRVAPESPGDLFDAAEIDQLLILSILALTDQEKAEMAASDPRARQMLARTEALTPEQLMALHGTIRELGSAR